MNTDSDRRANTESADLIEKALRMQSAFGHDAALRLLDRGGVSKELAELVLATRYDRRQRPPCTRSLT